MRVQALGSHTEAGAELQEFSDWLLEVGNGANGGDVLFPSQMVTPFEEEQELISKVFPGLHQGLDTIDSCILMPLNKDVNKINNFILQQFPGTDVTYLSADYFDPTNEEEHDSETYPTEFLNELCPHGLSTHRLTLKQGAPVIFIRNLSRMCGMMNGTRGVVESLHRHSLQIRLLSGPFKGSSVPVPRINLESGSDPNLHIKFTRRQFPLKLAWAMTINKSQGQTFKRVAVRLPS